MRRFRSLQTGFTLIELMIVVVIIGVLSVLAVSGYRRYTLAARNSEAESFLMAIRAQQESYKQAFGAYCGTPNGVKWPTDVPQQQKAQWDGADMPAAWKDLGMKSPGLVWFQYEIFAGTLPANAPPEGLAAAFNGVTGPWFAARAHGDFDNDGSESTFEIHSRRADVWRDFDNQ